MLEPPLAPGVPYRVANAELARFIALDEDEPETESSRPLTRFIDCVIAFKALDTIAEDELFTSFCTAEKSELALVRLPELKSPPRVAKSVASCEVEDELLPLMLLKLLLSCSSDCNAEVAPLTSPDSRLLCRFWVAVCIGFKLLASYTYSLRLPTLTPLMAMFEHPSAEPLPVSTCLTYRQLSLNTLWLAEESCSAPGCVPPCGIAL